MPTEKMCEVKGSQFEIMEWKPIQFFSVSLHVIRKEFDCCRQNIPSLLHQKIQENIKSKCFPFVHFFWPFFSLFTLKVKSCFCRPFKGFMSLARPGSFSCFFFCNLHPGKNANLANAMYYLLCTILTKTFSVCSLFQQHRSPVCPALVFGSKWFTVKTASNNLNGENKKNRAWHLSAGESQIVSLINQKWQKASFNTRGRAGSKQKLVWTHRETNTDPLWIFF